MKNIVKTMLVCMMAGGLLLQGLDGQRASAEPADAPDIRIGVVPVAEQLELGAKGSYEVVNSETGEILYSGNNSSVTVSLGGEAEVKTNFRLQVSFTTSEATVNDWLARAAAEGYATYVEPFGDGYRLLLGEFAPDASFADRTAFKEQAVDKGLAANDSYWRVVTIGEGEQELLVDTGDKQITVFNAVELLSDGEMVEINGNPYRGLAEAGFNSSGTLAGINELSIEDYLYGVVPHELPPVPYGEMEAQKSQAIAARTYALSNMGKRASDGYDLLSTTSDQVYGGSAIEHPISTEAVDGTRGIVATYDGELITAVYHSTSGGVTANNEDIWNSAATPYLRGTHVAQKGNSLKYVPALDIYKETGEGESLREAKKGDFEADWSRYYRWNFEWTLEEMSEVLSLYYNKEVGEVYEVNVLERSGSGRVAEIEFVTENGTFYEYKDRIRWALQYINASGAPAVLLSTLFIIEPVADKAGELIGFKVNGGGWGHGVGMSQVGAVGMAEKGYTHEVILKHFYQGIELETKY